MSKSRGFIVTASHDPTGRTHLAKSPTGDKEQDGRLFRGSGPPHFFSSRAEAFAALARWLEWQVANAHFNDFRVEEHDGRVSLKDVPVGHLVMAHGSDRYVVVDACDVMPDIEDDNVAVLNMAGMVVTMPGGRQVEDLGHVDVSFITTEEE